MTEYHCPRSWTQAVDNWLKSEGRDGFHYRELPSHLKNDSYFRRSWRRGYIVKTEKSYAGTVAKWRPTEHMGVFR